MDQRVGGMIQVQVDAVLLEAKGNFTWNLGNPKREAVLSTTGVSGYVEKPQVPFVEGEITLTQGVSADALTKAKNATVTLTLATGAVISLRQAWYAGEGTGNTEEGNMGVRYEGKSAQELL